MDGETRQPRPQAPPETPATGPPSEPPERVPAERFGPLAVERHRKEDGRALLLYELGGETH